MTQDTPWTPRTRKGGHFYRRTCNGHALRVYWVDDLARWSAYCGNAFIDYYYQSKHAKRAATKAAKEATK